MQSKKKKENLLTANNVTMERTPAGNSSLAKLAVQCSADTFVVNQTLVLRINICGKNRQLLESAKRYATC